MDLIIHLILGLAIGLFPLAYLIARGARKMQPDDLSDYWQEIQEEEDGTYTTFPL
jgi:hypothetical protein